MKEVIIVAMLLMVGVLGLFGFLSALNKNKAHTPAASTSLYTTEVYNDDLYMTIIHDSKRNNTCYITGGNGGGISCLQDQMDGGQ